MTTSCSCSNGQLKLIFACSGAADVGEIADHAARALTRAGCGKMFCLAGIGGRVPDILDRTRSADAILAIDGCEKDCVKQSLLHAGFTRFHAIRVTDLGFEKGKTPVTDDAVARVQAAAAIPLA